MNKKKVYIILGILVALLIGTVILYICLFGGNRNSDEAKSSGVAPNEGWQYVDAKGNVISEDNLPKDNQMSEQEAKEELEKLEKRNEDASQEFLSERVIPSEFTILNQDAGVDSADSASKAVKLKLEIDGVEVLYTRKLYTYAVELGQPDGDVPESAEEESAPDPDDEVKEIVTSVEKINGLDVTITADGEGYILLWTDAVYTNKLIVPLENSEENRQNAIKWAGMLM